MTDHPSSDDDRLAALDRRAAAAVAELDRSLPVDDEPPSFAPAGIAARRRLPVLPLVAAAIVVVVALVGLAVARLDGGVDQSTIAGEPDAAETSDDPFVRLAVADPSAVDLRVTAAYDGVADPASGATPPGVVGSIQGRADADDPWDEAVIAVSYPSADDDKLWGQLVDLGRVEGAINSAFPGTTLTWFDGNRSLQLTSATVGPDEVLAVARDAVDAGWTGEGALPGHRVLHDDHGFPSLSYLTPNNPIEAVGVGYAGEAGAPSFVLATLPGGEATARAAEAFIDPQRIEPVEVRGVPGVVLTMPGNVEQRMIVWRENDATVGWVETFDDPTAVIALLDGADVVDSAAFAELVDDHPAPDGGWLLELPERVYEDVGDPFEERPEVVAAELEVVITGSGRAEMILYEEPHADGYNLSVMITDANGGSGSGSSVSTLDRPAASWISSNDAHAIAGIVPGQPVSATISFGGGPALPVADLVATPVTGASSFAFLGWTTSAPGHQTGPHDAVMTIDLDDGEVVRFAV